LFGHWPMSFFWMLARDRGRLADCRKRTAISPLGAGALAGNPFPIDREKLAGVLGLDGVTENSMDGVSDRDFVAEFLFCAALVGSHISRLAEDLILYSGPGYCFVRIGEVYTTGSSLMPQKRNPDSLELARGKSGRLLGDLMAMLVVLKGLPSTYNKDLQEDKEPVFDAADTLAVFLPVVAGVVGSLEVDSGAMRDAMDEAMLATDLADYLVRRGVAFREAHHLVGRLVKEAEGRGVTLSGLPLGVMQGISDRIGEDVYGVFDVELSVGRRVVSGGTAPEAVRRQMAVARGYLQEGGSGGGG
jgi:argininosuccinate lyase